MYMSYIIPYISLSYHMLSAFNKSHHTPEMASRLRGEDRTAKDVAGNCRLFALGKERSPGGAPGGTDGDLGLWHPRADLAVLGVQNALFRIGLGALSVQIIPVLREFVKVELQLVEVELPIRVRMILNRSCGFKHFRDTTCRHAFLHVHVA